MRPHLYTLLALFLTSANASIALAQHQISLEAGAGLYAIHGATTRLDVSQNGSVFSHGESRVPGFSNVGALGLTYRYTCAPRIRLGAGIYHLGAKDIINEGEYLQSPGIPDSEIQVDLSSEHLLSATRFDFTVWYDLFPNRKVSLWAGTGLSLMFREHDYRTFLQVDYGFQNQPNFSSVQYIYDDENSAGIPLLLQAELPFWQHWCLLGAASGAFYSNREVSLLLTAGIAYHW